jgi:soluble lytic murein transglycosylase-like protein
MFEGFNDVLKQISSLNKNIESMKQTPEETKQKIREEIDQELPFADIFKQKKTESGTKFGSMIDNASKTEGVDSDLVRAVIDTESNFNPNARSSDGAIGLMQLMPGTARELGIDPKNPEENIKGGVRYLGKMMDRFDDLEKSIAAYNAGPAAVERFNGVPPFEETQNYVKNVLSTFRQLKQNEG